MSDLEWFNDRLKFQLEQPENYSYQYLIEATIKSEDVKLKCDLNILLMNFYSSRIIEENLRKAITQFYCADKDIDSYLNKIVSYNPKFGTISITASHGSDMEHENSLCIEVPIRFHEDVEKQFQEVSKVEKKIKEVIKMILVESKIIVP
jgi:hypothetical protein